MRQWVERPPFKPTSRAQKRNPQIFESFYHTVHDTLPPRDGSSNLTTFLPSPESTHSILPRQVPDAKSKYEDRMVEISFLMPGSIPTWSNCLPQGKSPRDIKFAFTRYERGGEGTVVYMLDSGIDKRNPVTISFTECRKRESNQGRESTHYCRKTAVFLVGLTNYPKNQDLADVTIQDWIFAGPHTWPEESDHWEEYHGTTTAQLIAGDEAGFARRTEIVAVKFDTQAGDFFLDALCKILDHITTYNLRKKGVFINISAAADLLALRHPQFNSEDEKQDLFYHTVKSVLYRMLLDILAIPNTIITTSLGNELVGGPTQITDTWEF